MQRADGRVVEPEQASTLEDTTRSMMACARSSSCGTQPQAFKGLFVVKDHRSMPTVPFVHDMEEHGGRVAALSNDSGG